MDRRNFIRLSAGGAAVTLLPLGACSSGPLLPPIEPTGGPLVVTPTGARIETRPNAHAIVVADRRVGRLGSALGAFNYPSAIAVAGGLVYVVETGNHRVQILEEDGTSIGAFGAGVLSYPSGIAATVDGELIVADSRNGRLVAFDPDGAVIRTYGDGELSAPRGVAILGSSMFVADPGLHAVVELDASGRTVRRLDGDWVLPYDVTTDGARLFVVDASESAIRVAESGRIRERIELERAATFVSYASDGTLYVS